MKITLLEIIMRFSFSDQINCILHDKNEICCNLRKSILIDKVSLEK